ncbi:unnamed protein product [Durusdinium trenchii]|uniref:guanylate kinase n=1 Tax=Durusdinium trenchii TaxID=1381693 RepID=A0ABP0PRM4_9DINO
MPLAKLFYGIYILLRWPLVIVGPSGVGKGTLIAKIREGFAGRFGFSVSHTTRKPRPGEVHGEAYNFVDMETMQKELKIPGRFLEHATVHGNLYGTSQEAVEKVRQRGQICILDVDVQGARQIKKIHSDFNYLFIAPPSVESLEKRLRARGTETEEKIQTRLRNARSEIDFYKENVDFFNDVLVNDDLGLASSRALDLMRSWYPELVQQAMDAPDERVLLVSCFVMLRVVDLGGCLRIPTSILRSPRFIGGP